MPIPTRCQCGARFAVPDKLAGRKVKCPKCTQPVQVPTAEGATAPPAPIGIKCQCGKSMKVPGKFAGKAVKCPSCGEPVHVPDPSKAAAAAMSAAAELSPEDGVGDLLDEADLSLSKTGRRCPECRQDLQLDDVLCIHCGYNTETGKKIKVKKVDRGRRIGNIVINDDAKAKPDAPAPVEALVKLLNQAGAIALLMGAGVVAFLGYQKMQANPNLGSDAFVSVLTGAGGYVLGIAFLLITVPAAIAANLVQTGKPVGRILSMVVGFLSLLGIPILTLLGVLIIRLALTDEVSRYCRP